MSIPSKFKNVKTLAELEALCKKSGFYDVAAVYEIDETKAVAAVNTLNSKGELEQFELEVAL